MRATKFENIKELYERDKGICHICGLWVAPEDATKDHIIPRVNLKGRTPLERNEIGRGGRNLALAHYLCNHERGSAKIEGYPAPFFKSNTPRDIKKINEHKHSQINSIAASRCLATRYFIPCPCIVCVCNRHVPKKIGTACSSCFNNIHRELKRAS